MDEKGRLRTGDPGSKSIKDYEKGMGSNAKKQSCVVGQEETGARGQISTLLPSPPKPSLILMGCLGICTVSQRQVLGWQDGA